MEHQPGDIAAVVGPSFIAERLSYLAYPLFVIVVNVCICHREDRMLFCHCLDSALDHSLASERERLMF